MISQGYMSMGLSALFFCSSWKMVRWRRDGFRVSFSSFLCLRGSLLSFMPLKSAMGITHGGGWWCRRTGQGMVVVSIDERVLTASMVDSIDGIPAFFPYGFVVLSAPWARRRTCGSGFRRTPRRPGRRWPRRRRGWPSTVTWKISPDLSASLLSEAQRSLSGVHAG